MPSFSHSLNRRVVAALASLVFSSLSLSIASTHAQAPPSAPAKAPAKASAPARTPTPAKTAATAVPGADLDAYVARVMKTFDVPGISLAIVKDGRVVVAKGYGVRKLGESAPVDEKTLFGIASNTKVFTATALGLLVEEGKIEWDAPVITYLPWFQMYDPYVTRELTVRDLLVHRSGLGLGAGDLIWWPPSTYTRKEVAQRLRFIKPATSFRSAYAYDNVLYLVAGEVIEAISGQSWEDFITERILKKVGMTGSRPRHSDATGGGNIASPHASIDGKVSPVKPFDSDNTNPAGGINSSAEDMAKWMLVRLADGQLADGSRLYSERTSRALTTLVTPVPFNNPPPELAALRFNFRGYGLGLDLHDYRGHKVITHTGGLPGYVSKVTVIPDAKLGVAVLTNQESGAAFSSLTWHVVDQYLGARDPGTPATDWVDAYAKVVARQSAEIAATEQKAIAARDTSSKPSLPLERYAGTYTDAWYGDIAIALENGKLVMRFTHTPALVGDLEHWQHDTFIARWRDRELRADAYVIVALDADGSIDQIKMRAVSPATDFSFDFQDLLLRPARRPAASSHD
jgi:CubicO group peptidase (beta-lactamase class C family)